MSKSFKAKSSKSAWKSFCKKDTNRRIRRAAKISFFLVEEEIYTDVKVVTDVEVCGNFDPIAAAAKYRYWMD